MDDRLAPTIGWLDLSDAERLRLLETALDLQDVAVAITGASEDRAGGRSAASADPVILHVNRAFERMTGYTLHEVAGRPPGPLLGEPAEPGGDDRTARFTARNRRKDGEPYWCDIRRTPADGAPADGARARAVASRTVAAARDVSAAQAVDGERRRAEALLAGLLAGVDAPFVLTDRHARLFLVSAAARHALEGDGGLRLAPGTPLTALVAPADRDAVSAALARLTGGETAEARLAVHLADGRRSGLTLHAFGGADGATTVVATLAPAARSDADPDRRAVPAPVGGAGPERRTVTAGRLQLIELGDVRSAFGQRWESRRGQAVAAAHRIIKSRLTPADTVQRTADDGFVICFAELSEAEGRFKAEAIAEEIRTWFMGEDGSAPPPRLSTVVAEVAVDQDDEADPEALLGEIDAHLRACLEGAERDALAALRDALQSGALRVAPVLGKDGRPTALRRPALPAHTADLVDRARLALPERHSVAFQAAALLLTRTIERVADDATAGRRHRYVVALTYDAFDKRSWSDHVFSILRGVGEPIRQALVLEIRGAPWESGQVRLKSLSSMLAGMVYAVAIELPRADAPLVADLPDETRLVTLAERHLPRDDGRSGAEAREKAVARLAGRLRPKRRRLLIAEVADGDAARRYLDCGADLVCGPAFEDGADSRST